MARLKEAAEAAGTAARRVVEKVETQVLVAEGRRSLKAKARTTAKVARKAVKTGAVVGALTAVAVVAREVRKRRRLNG